ncbi:MULTISPECIES: 16S rRNA (guanine(966)-N(2))-methyltransferase RsmD [unclassified Brevibacterium]|uniref:16S rRNA (guanine(966)-N(2))-methyltransferase RsmD n=1 Tax=unclassified Brevibacterium TaxID=2614124 RepID=UPI001080CA1C|nr:16S rRNA (guanine(966)-N(2))-methyltransferase RsmD [Brevibacterium sp. S111]TGD11346.1 16S rRNA (guanine(966)-N(2))-methyltransferase RsmD [Brevibacterium sp. S111]
MRIIAGAHKGARLSSPSGANTRPTADRVKESLFSMLEGYGVLQAANVLDLFAGSGGLGFEAMSRGAAQVDFVDSSLTSIRSLQSNAEKLGIEHSAEVHAGDVLHFLAGLPVTDAPEARTFDLVFMDPPYPLSEDAVTQILGRLTAHLDLESIVVVERAARSPEPTMPDGLEVFRSKTFGETAVHFVQLVGEPGEA